MTNVNTNATTEGYYDFTATCMAYVNDIRVVQPKSGKKKDAFVSVKIAILEGDKEEPNKVFADLIVRGEQAQQIIKSHWKCRPKFGQKNSWFASLRIGSMYVKTYKSNGETKATMGGRLLAFTYLKIGDTVIELPQENAEPQPQAAPQPLFVPQAQQPAPQQMTA